MIIYFGITLSNVKRISNSVNDGHITQNKIHNSQALVKTFLSSFRLDIRRRKTKIVLPGSIVASIPNEMLSDAASCEVLYAKGNLKNFILDENHPLIIILTFNYSAQLKIWT